MHLTKPYVTKIKKISHKYLRVKLKLEELRAHKVNSEMLHKFDLFVLRVCLDTNLFY